jgi:hypothetical protein
MCCNPCAVSSCPAFCLRSTLRIGAAGDFSFEESLRAGCCLHCALSATSGGFLQVCRVGVRLCKRPARWQLGGFISQDFTSVSIHKLACCYSYCCCCKGYIQVQVEAASAVMLPQPEYVRAVVRLSCIRCGRQAA